MIRQRRNNFTSETKRQAYARSGGICECHLIPDLGRPQGCGVQLRTGHINYEHIIQSALGGRNDLDNCATLARNCWREKTDTIDLPLIARNNRQQDRARGIYPISRSPLPGSRDDRIKKKISGEVVLR